MNGNSKAAKGQQGFTILQMVSTITIIAIISTVGVLGVRSARAEFRLQNSARLFASYVEKARADSIRRHAEEGQESSVETFGPGTNTYAVTMDFGSGSVETRNFTLDVDLVFATAAQKVTFNWRGRITEPCDITKACVFQVQSDIVGRNIPVDVSGSGDITVGEQHFPDLLIPEVAMSNVGDGDGVDGYSSPTPPVDVDPSPDPDPVDGGGGDTNPTPTPTPTPATPTPTPTPNGNGNGNGGNGSDNGNNGNGGNGNASPTPTPVATPTPSIPQCVAILSPTTLSLSQSDPTKHTGTATFVVSNGSGERLLSATLAGNGNSLVLGMSLSRIDGNGTSVVTVTTKNGAGNRGNFIVNVAADPACGGTQQLTVSVTN